MKTLREGTRIELKTNVNNGKLWYIEFYLNDFSSSGKRIRKTFNLNRIKDEKERFETAQFYIQKLENEFAYQNKFRKHHLSAQQAIDEALHIKSSKTDRPKSMTTYNSISGIFLEWLTRHHLNNLNIQEIDKQLALSFLDSTIKERNISNRTHNNYICALRSVFTELVERDIIKTNPFSNIKELKVSEASRRAMSNYEKNLIMEAIRKSGNWSLQAAVLLLYYTFIRPSELRRLRFRDIDLRKSMIYLKGSVTKNRDSSQLTMNINLVEELKLLKFDKYKPDWFVFGASGLPDPEKQIGEHTLNNMHNAILKKLKKSKAIDINNISLYSWKDTGAADMLEAGISINRLRNHLRHKNLSDTQKYLKPLAGFDPHIRNLDLFI